MAKNWAITIGINHYYNLQTLNYAKQDAEAMQNWFEKEAGFNQVFLFTEDSQPIAAKPQPIPTQPSFANFYGFLEKQFEKPLLNPEDNLWFFFAGHGIRYRDQDYLMFLDSAPTAVDRTAISVDYVIQRLRRSGADNVVLFIDACRNEGDRGGLGIGEEEHQGVITFYSCNANQKSWEIDELQHGSFTHTLLEGLRIQGEANCATVERLEQHLSYYVPKLNAHYRKPLQNPYLKAEPPYKMYYVLLEKVATLKDAEPLKYRASQAENKGEFELAKQLWKRVLALPGVDEDAWEAIERISRIQLQSPTLVSNLDVATSSIGGRGTTTETPAQREKQQQQLEKFQQPFTTSRRRFLQLLGLGSGGLAIALVSRNFVNNSLKPEPKPIRLQKFGFDVVTVNSQGEISNPTRREAELFQEDLGNGVILEMVSIPGGSFKMGSPPGEKGRQNDEQPQHTVNVPAFSMGRFEVTQEQYQQVMSKNPSLFKGDKSPVENVSWNDAVEFCKKLSRKTGRTYRLPSEAEWEYACRARTTTPFYFGETITSELANYNASKIYASEPKGKYRKKTTPVGKFPANAFGLYDMHGNVWEWCQDNWHNNYNGAPKNGSAWLTNDNRSRMLRGGSWDLNPNYCRSADRSYGNSNHDYSNVGLRVVCGVAPRTQ